MLTADDPGGVVESLGRQRQRGRVESIGAPWWQMRILVDRFIYQGLRYAQADTPPAISAYAGSLQDQDEKGSVSVTTVRTRIRHLFVKLDAHRI
jgi:hypothetical protein